MSYENCSVLLAPSSPRVSKDDRFSSFLPDSPLALPSTSCDSSSFLSSAMFEYEGSTHHDTFSYIQGGEMHNNRNEDDVLYAEAKAKPSANNNITSIACASLPLSPPPSSFPSSSPPRYSSCSSTVASSTFNAAFSTSPTSNWEGEMTFDSPLEVITGYEDTLSPPNSPSLHSSVNSSSLSPPSLLTNPSNGFCTSTTVSSVRIYNDNDRQNNSNMCREKDADEEYINENLNEEVPILPKNKAKNNEMFAKERSGNEVRNDNNNNNNNNDEDNELTRKGNASHTNNDYNCDTMPTTPQQSKRRTYIPPGRVHLLHRIRERLLGSRIMQNILNLKGNDNDKEIGNIEENLSINENSQNNVKKNTNVDINSIRIRNREKSKIYNNTNNMGNFKEFLVILARRMYYSSFTTYLYIFVLFINFLVLLWGVTDRPLDIYFLLAECFVTFMLFLEVAMRFLIQKWEFFKDLSGKFDFCIMVICVFLLFESGDLWKYLYINPNNLSSYENNSNAARNANTYNNKYGIIAGYIEEENTADILQQTLTAFRFSTQLIRFLTLALHHQRAQMPKDKVDFSMIINDDL